MTQNTNKDSCRIANAYIQSSRIAKSDRAGLGGQAQREKQYEYYRNKLLTFE